MAIQQNCQQLAAGAIKVPYSKNGFTLIELMVTIAVISIVLAIAVPNLMLWVNQTRVKGVAENFAQDLVFARTEAIRLNKPIRLNVQSTCYGLTAATTACNCTVTDTAASNFCDLKRVGDWRNITIDTNSTFDNIIFDSVRGLPVDSSFGALTATQTADIAQTGVGAIKASLSVIGSACLSSTGSSKISGYSDAC